MNTMESFMLASINSKSGNLLYSRSMLTYGLAGIALRELVSMGRLSFDGKRLAVEVMSLTDDELLNDILSVLSKKPSPRKIYSLISDTSFKVRRFSKRVLERLEDNGFIKIEQKRFLGLISYDYYVISRVREHEKLVEELKDIVLKGEKKPVPQKALMIIMMSACGVLRRLFDREERQQVGDTLKKIGKAEFFEGTDDFDKELQKAVKAAIAAAQAAAT